MNELSFPLAGARLAALPSGALWWPAERVLIAADLHLGKSERIARRGGTLLPPYETRETLARLDADLAATGPAQVICLGDSFDDLAAAEALPAEEALWLTRMMAGRRWIWVEGNHDPGPMNLGGTHLAELRLGPLVFRHIAQEGAMQGQGATAEVSGHYHPKARVAGVTRPCFLLDRQRLILPAYGAYTGGLSTTDPALAGLMAEGALALMLGRPPKAIPMPRGAVPKPQADRDGPPRRICQSGQRSSTSG